MQAHASKDSTRVRDRTGPGRPDQHRLLLLSLLSCSPEGSPLPQSSPLRHHSRPRVAPPPAPSPPAESIAFSAAFRGVLPLVARRTCQCAALLKRKARSISLARLEQGSGHESACIHHQLLYFPHATATTHYHYHHHRPPLLSALPVLEWRRTHQTTTLPATHSCPAALARNPRVWDAVSQTADRRCNFLRSLARCCHLPSWPMGAALASIISVGPRR